MVLFILGVYFRRWTLSWQRNLSKMSEKWLEARLFIALKRMDILDDVMFARSVIARPLSVEI